MQAVYCTIAENPGLVLEAILRTYPEITVVSTTKKADKQNALSAFPVREIPLETLFEGEGENLRFFLPQDELRQWVAVKTALHLLTQGASAAVFLQETQTAEKPVPVADRQDYISFTVCASEKPSMASTLRQAANNFSRISFHNGPALRRYLAWVDGRFTYNYKNGFSSVADTAHTGKKGDTEAGFAYEWPGYAALFRVAGETVPGEDNPLPLYAGGGKPQRFDDGVVLHPLLKPYFVRNYRLRLACKNNPFAHRPLFTDATVVPGEENGPPLTAMADCIWQNRPDLQALFPAPKTGDRRGYLHWYAANAAGEYGLEDAYIAPVQKALALPAQYVGNAKRTGIRKGRLFGRAAKVEEPNPTPRYDSGVNLCAHIRGEYGIGEAGRMLALTLQAAGQPFTIVDIASERDRDYSNTEWVSKISNTFPYDINLMYTNADGVKPFLESISPDALKHRYNIGFWAWEMPQFPDKWTEAFTPFDEIWTLSQFSADAIASKSPVPVYSMPHPVVLAAPDPRYNRQYFGLPEESFVFLAMYDVRSVPERKNPMDAVRAFLQAFEGRKDVVLALKVNAPEGWRAEGELAELLGCNGNIQVVDAFLPRPVLNGLLACCDAYVSLHRCEGFGFGPAEAMFYRKPAVVTAWSGSMEYTADGACCPVKYSLVELDRDYGPYQKGWQWAQPDIADAAAQMLRLVKDRDFYEEVAENGQKLIQTQFSAEHMARKVAQRLTTIRKKYL